MCSKNRRLERLKEKLLSDKVEYEKHSFETYLIQLLGSEDLNLPHYTIVVARTLNHIAQQDLRCFETEHRNL